jgi:hypothetical protein
MNITESITLHNIEKFLRENNMTPTKFGRIVAGDPRLVFDIRLGREPRLELQKKCYDFMCEYAAEDSNVG